MTTRFHAVIGTGGIGTGIIYRLVGDHDLSRNESRLAQRVDQRDFCKLHIVFHYVARLCRELGLKTQVLPIGAVGDDPEGKALLTQMRQAGLRLTYTHVLREARTLFSVCYQFPDGSGGNFTELNSASAKVTPALIRAAKNEFRKPCLAVALPEVPLPSRVALLRLAKRNRAFTAASFVSHEMPVVRREGLLRNVDLLSINCDEAAALAGLGARQTPRRIVAATVKYVRGINPQLRLCVTAGAHGVFGFAGDTLEHLPALKVKVMNTAGAGDAALAGQIVGVVAGQPWRVCLRWGRRLAALSVTSPDTIHFGINRKSLRAFDSEDEL